MKTDINSILNKLVAYAMDNLLLDTLDQTYTINRLATLCGVTEPTIDPDADYGDSTLDSLLVELAAVLPAVDKTAVADILMPMARTVNYYLENKLARGADKAFDFLFDLYAHGYNSLATSPAVGKDGYVCYALGTISPVSAAALSVGEQLIYTPLCAGNRIARLQNPDILSDDIVSRESAFVSAYGECIAARIGSDSDYLCCHTLALSSAKVKSQLADSTVKIALLDYPVPALSFSGIAKNAVQREVTRVIKAAAEQNIPCVVAAAPSAGGVVFYTVFATDIATNEFILGADALSVCGVVQVKDCSPLLSVLEKGTALSTDLAAYKPIYDKIGGVKLGKDAVNSLGGALVEMYLPLLKAAASATEQKATELAAVK